MVGMPCSTSAAPTVILGLRRRAWNGAPMSVPNARGRNGTSPGLGGGAHPG